nr:MAG TPA: hypothetical protein [Caudoviricetes sp.]
MPTMGCSVTNIATSVFKKRNVKSYKLRNYNE